MKRDFTLDRYRDLILALAKEDYTILPSPGQTAGTKEIILRHDIDDRPEMALTMATLEKGISVRSSFFFKTAGRVFRPEIIRQIASMGHVIGYHYEDLVRNHGDHEKAISDFEQNLDRIRQVYPVSLICADGDPLSKFSNLWLWDRYDYRRFGITHEMYLDLDYDRYAYYTDTGRHWRNDPFNVWDHVKSLAQWPQYRTTDEMIHAIQQGVFPMKASISIHPQRWHGDLAGWVKELAWQNAKNIVKWGLVRFKHPGP